ncbi:hypothetical protein [Sphingobium sp. TCM1]|uniref:hypothetical protein n=1 Tax=Sphingobium sp. TCM1 TaxID=453246 RepID=UPI0007F4D7DD|nr:hypothetical protein [Sphingobium sp. TCM1]OAN56691.1 hypothetical protein A7Q26_19175 [Sphingobium sp. TCM1]
MAKLMLMGLVLASVLLAAAAQLILKIGMSGEIVQRALTQNDLPPFRAAIVVATSPLVICGLTCFVLSAVIWLLVLAHVELSIAYPFVGLGLVITVTSSHFVLGEAMTASKLVGVGAIVFGVMLIGLSAPSKTRSQHTTGGVETARSL